jgi:ArsR family transcriptional regulator
MSNNQNIDIERFAEVFKALSNPNRLRIFLRLVSCCAPGTIQSIDSGSRAYVGELGKDLGIVPSTVSHHIKELYRAGLIKMQRQGQKIECWIDPQMLSDLNRFFNR